MKVPLIVRHLPKAELGKKYCLICFQIKSLDEFHIHRRKSDGHRNDCKECRKLHKTRKRELQPIKLCYGCNKIYLNTEEFFFQNKNAKINKLRSLCKFCCAISRRKTELKRDYNLLLEDVEQKKIEQNNKCAICGQSEKRLVVDHCHKTNRFRGLLCDDCNHGLGNFKDKEELFLEAIKYLKLNRT